MYALQKQVNILRKDMNKLPERKQFVQPHNTGGVGTGGYIYPMTAIVQGDTESNRTGLEITPKRFDMYLQCNAEASNSNEHRLIVFRWFDDAAPGVDDILYSTTTGIFNGYEKINVPIRWVDKPKFQILADQRFSTLDETDTEHMNFSFKKMFKKNAKITYEGSTGESDIRGALYYLVVNDSAVVPHPTYQGYSRLQFTDA